MGEARGSVAAFKAGAAADFTAIAAFFRISPSVGCAGIPIRAGGSRAASPIILPSSLSGAAGASATNHPNPPTFAAVANSPCKPNPASPPKEAAFCNPVREKAIFAACPGDGVRHNFPAAAPAACWPRIRSSYHFPS